MEEKEEKKKIKKVKKIEENKFKVNFKISGSHIGKKTLICDPTGLLDQNMRFNGSNNVISKLKRPHIGTNLIKIYEGVTISYATSLEDKIYSIFKGLGFSKNSAKNRYGDYYSNNKSPIYPFILFAVDSEGGISIMIYYGRGCGDIVIDCGFS